MTREAVKQRRIHTGNARLVLPFMALMLFALLAGGAVPANAAAPGVLWQNCPPGEGAGECLRPGALASDPNTGDVYVLDRRNNRVVQLSAWGTFRKAWGWGVVDGSAELQVCGPDATPPTATCQRGIRGVGPGQLAGQPADVSNRPGLDLKGIAVDSQGFIYVYESESCESARCEAEPHANRVQKFEPEGTFTLMFGKEVNLTEVAEREEQEANSEPVTVTPQEENLCTAASGDACGPGVKGGGDEEFGGGSLLHDEAERNLIAVSFDDTVYIGGQERIQRFDSEGQFIESVAIPGEAVFGLAVDGSGNAYTSFADNSTDRPKPGVAKLSPSGATLCTATVEKPHALATDSVGNLYVADGEESVPSDQIFARIRKFGADCVEETDLDFGVEGLLNGSYATGLATSSACGIDGTALYYSSHQARSDPFRGPTFVRAYRPAPDPEICPPPAVAPTIAAQYAESVAGRSAVVGAEINPHFWPDTTYFVEYGTEPCGSSPDACGETELLPGAPLDAEDDVAAQTPGALLGGLQPDTTYHFRFVAESGGGGPVVGVGEAEASGSFRTYPPPLPSKLDCPNQATRYGPSARLPDCRAYELVSPAEKEGGDVNVATELINHRARILRSSESGDRFTYSSWKSFGDQASTVFANQYLAERGDGGWVSHGINLPQTGSVIDGAFLGTHYQAFTPDLSSGWSITLGESPLTADALEGYVNLYRRDTADGSLEALSNAGPFAPTPPNLGGPATTLRLQGYSADLDHQVFATRAALTPDAATDDTEQIYDLSGGALRLVSVLPNGAAATGDSAVGGGSAVIQKRDENVERAVSRDGSRIYWSNDGTIYARVDGEETEHVSRRVSSLDARYWSASADGARALFAFTEGIHADELYRFDLASRDASKVAGEVQGVLGTSEDLSHVYFVSREALAEGATAGSPNLYLDHEGSKTFIADAGGAYQLANSAPLSRASRVTPDGRHIAFQSTASLTGFDSTDVDTGNPATQVFVYDAEEAVLRCVSCNPGGARPDGRELLAPQADPPYSASTGTWGAAWIPGSEWVLNTSRPLAADGSRIFFNSYDSLLPRDANNRMDVYEWEKGESQAECEALGAELYLQEEGGCLSLISTGESSEDSEFADATPSGDDVFFKTSSGIDPADPGLADFYVARVGGGFARPAPPDPCVGDACQNVPAPPADPTPASATFRGLADARPGSGCATRTRRAAKRRLAAKRLRRQANRVHRRVKRLAAVKRKRRATRHAKRLRRRANRAGKRAKRLTTTAKRCRRNQRGAAR